MEGEWVNVDHAVMLSARGERIYFAECYVCNIVKEVFDYGDRDGTYFDDTDTMDVECYYDPICEDCNFVLGIDADLRVESGL